MLIHYQTTFGSPGELPAMGPTSSSIFSHQNTAKNKQSHTEAQQCLGSRTRTNIRGQKQTDIQAAADVAVDPVPPPGPVHR